MADYPPPIHAYYCRCADCAPSDADYGPGPRFTRYPEETARQDPATSYATTLPGSPYWQQRPSARSQHYPTMRESHHQRSYAPPEGPFDGQPMRFPPDQDWPRSRSRRPPEPAGRWSGPQPPVEDLRDQANPGRSAIDEWRKRVSSAPARDQDDMTVRTLSDAEDNLIGSTDRDLALEAASTDLLRQFEGLRTTATSNTPNQLAILGPTAPQRQPLQQNGSQVESEPEDNDPAESPREISASSGLIHELPLSSRTRAYRSDFQRRPNPFTVRTSSSASLGIAGSFLDSIEPANEPSYHDHESDGKDGSDSQANMNDRSNEEEHKSIGDDISFVSLGFDFEKDDRGEGPGTYDYGCHLPYGPDLPGEEALEKAEELPPSHPENEAETDLGRDTVSMIERHYNIVADICGAMTQQLSIEDLESTFVPARQQYLRYCWTKLTDQLTDKSTDATGDDGTAMIVLTCATARFWLSHCQHYEHLFLRMYRRLEGLLQNTLEDFTDTDRQPLHSDDEVLDWLATRMRPKIDEIYAEYVFGEKGFNRAVHAWVKHCEELHKHAEVFVPRLVPILGYMWACQPRWVPFPPEASLPRLPQMPSRINIPQDEAIEKYLTKYKKLVIDAVKPIDIFG